MKAGSSKTGITLALASVLLAGCAISTEYRTPDGWVNYVVHCGGPMLNFGSCLEKAGDICRGRGYKVLDHEGGQLPGSPTAMPPAGPFESALKGETGKAAVEKYEIRKLYIRCN